jgi:hypothetical protein
MKPSKFQRVRYQGGHIVFRGCGGFGGGSAEVTQLAAVSEVAEVSDMGRQLKGIWRSLDILTM